MGGAGGGTAAWDCWEAACDWMSGSATVAPPPAGWATATAACLTELDTRERDPGTKTTHITSQTNTDGAMLSCFPKPDQYKPTSWGNLLLWFSVIRLKMFCTAGRDTRNPGRTVVAMETRRWHADKSNFSGTCGTQRSGRLAFSQSQRMRKNGLNRINLTIYWNCKP